MSRRPRFIQLPLAGIIFLCVLAVVYQGYLIVLASHIYSELFPGETIVEHQVNENPEAVIRYWTVATMESAIDADQQSGITASSIQQSAPGDISAGKAVKQQGSSPRSGEPGYPLSTVGRVFFTNDAGQNLSCSGTALVSSNRSVVDTAGHCVYWQRSWVHNLIFCPLYDHGASPYGCWAARELEAPSEWIDARPYNFHRDFGMAIVAPNDAGYLTDVVGGAGWAYNQPINQSFSAYGYPAAPPFDGQSRQSCESSSARTWPHGGGTVISIPCNMTGGSSGGPWFIKSGGNWYVDGHNDFISSLQPGHMFSPYYDDTWYAMYDKAQHA
jgi:V8-like Glu-specific endopeptidase